MNIRCIQMSSLLAAAALATAGCENMSPAENGAVFGALGGATAGGLARASGMNTRDSVITGLAAGAVVGVITYIVAKHQADERQRRIAEARAQAAYERRQASLRRKRVRYIAVDTVKNDQTSPQAKKSVMIWDTQSQEVVGDQVYDVKSPPPVGSTAKFDTYSAEYVGGGS